MIDSGESRVLGVASVRQDCRYWGLIGNLACQLAGLLIQWFSKTEVEAGLLVKLPLASRKKSGQKR